MPHDHLRTVLLIALTGALASATATYARGSHAPPQADLSTQAPVPITQEPRHRIMFESGLTRVHDVQVPPGDTTLYHIHDSPILYVPIGRSATRSQLLGGEWTGGDASQPAAPPSSATPPSASNGATPGRVTSTVSYVEKPVTHRVGNVGDSLFRLIAVVNRSMGSDADTDDVSGLASKPELVNRYYRAYRVTLAPGASTAAHKHVMPVVVVEQTAGRLGINGSTKAELMQPGQFSYHDGSGMHQVKNLGTTPVEVIEVELRGATPK